MGVRGNPLTVDSIIKRYNKLTSAEDFERKRGGMFLRLTINILEILSNAEDEVRLHDLGGRLGTDPRRTRQVLDNMEAGGTVKVNDYGPTRNRLSTFSGKHYSLTKDGKKAALHTKDFKSLPDYDSVFGFAGLTD